MQKYKITIHFFIKKARPWMRGAHISWILSMFMDCRAPPSTPWSMILSQALSFLKNLCILWILSIYYWIFIDFRVSPSTPKVHFWHLYAFRSHTPLHCESQRSWALAPPSLCQDWDLYWIQKKSITYCICTGKTAHLGLLEQCSQTRWSRAVFTNNPEVALVTPYILTNSDRVY